jgi:hypothetical protein
MFVEYPKALYRGGIEDGVTVHDADSEAMARADGYEMYAEMHARGDKPEPKEEVNEIQPAKRGRKPKAE